jgi:hypothetical protein
MALRDKLKSELKQFTLLNLPLIIVGLGLITWGDTIWKPLVFVGWILIFLSLGFLFFII